MTPFRNETERYVVVLQGVEHYGTGVYLAVYMEDRQAAVLRAEDGCHPCMRSRAELISALARQRAVLTVRGELRVAGEVVLPEDYIALWRRAFAKPLTPAQLAVDFGLTLVASATVDLARLAAALMRRQPACLAALGAPQAEHPSQSIEEFETRWAAAMHPEPGTRNGVRVVLDLLRPGAAADAFLLTNVTSPDSDETVAVLTIQVHAAAPHAQAVVDRGAMFGLRGATSEENSVLHD
jgi:hypothetical protein